MCDVNLALVWQLNRPVLIIVLCLVLLKVCVCVPRFLCSSISIQLLSCVAAYCSVLVDVLLSGVAFVNIVIKHYIYFLYLMQVYGEGSGFECRKHVQRLNLLRRNMDEQALAGSDEGDSMKLDTDSVSSVDVAELQNQVMTYTYSYFCHLF